MSKNRKLSKDKIYKCFYTNIMSQKDKMDELKCLVLNIDFDIMDILETWWEDNNQWSAFLTGYNLYRNDRRVFR